MKLNNYLKIIINGLSDVDNLKSYFIRQQKVNERDNFITKVEFYSKLINVTTDLKSKCEEKYYKRKNELYSILSLKKTINEPTKYIEDEINVITPDKFPLNLLHITSGTFKGFISYSDVKFIESVILEILKSEINSLPKNQQTETKKPDEVKENKHLDYFKNNAFVIWQSMFDEFKIKESSYNKDLDFMYAIMYEKGLIHKHVGKQNMLDWISETYQMAFSKIQYTNYKDSSNKTRMTVFNMINSK